MREEYQIKIAGNIKLSFLLSLGAEVLGQNITQKDHYLVIDKKVFRIREEAGKFILTQKNLDRDTKALAKYISEESIPKAEAMQLIKKHGVQVTVFKNRTVLRLKETVITLDEVEHIGEFIELRSSNEEQLSQTLEQLGLKADNIIRESYRDLMIAQKLPTWLHTVLRFHDRVGELAFGITSGILTTVGVLAGVSSATSSKLSIIAAIVAVATADSCSDAYGMYMSKTLERGSTQEQAIRYALGTFAGKLFFPLTFLVPLLVLSLENGILVSFVWGTLSLSILSAEQAIVLQQSVVKTIVRNVGLATLIVIFSTIVGSMVAKLL